MGNKSKRTRVGADKFKQSVSTQKGGGDWFKLPKGIEVWAPEKKGTYLLDIVPYEVTSKKNIDRIEPGALWWKHPFGVHHGVGVNEESVICPSKTLGKPCPMCEEEARLKKAGYEENKEAIRLVHAQDYTAYNILHPDDSNRIAIFALSNGKFAKKLGLEFEEQDDDSLALFYDVTDDGKTLAVRFSTATFNGKEYLEATRIEFKSRDAMDEDEILGKTVNLDEMFQCMTYDQLKALWLGEDEAAGGEGEDDGDDEEKPAKKKSKAPVDDEDEDDEPTPAPKKSKKPEPEPEDDDDEEPEEKPAKKGSKAKAPVDNDNDDDEPEEKPAKKSKKPEPEDDDDDDDDDEPAPAPKKKSKAPVDDDEEPEEKPAKKGGKTCPHKGGKFGKDVDKYDECDDCPLWNACEEASEA